MRQETGFLGDLLDCLDDQIAVVDAGGQIVYVNQAWKRFGFENGLPQAHEWTGVNYLQVCSASAAGGEDDARKAYDGILSVLRGDAEQFHFEYPCHSATERRWFLMRLTPLRGGMSRQFVLSHVNITERKLIEEQIEAQSLTDALTGVANRRRFEQFLVQEWQRNMREHTPISLIMFDLDHFKNFNDRHGHVSGDRCLRSVGDILLRHARRPTDLAARYGGEEFALILSNTDLNGSEMTAEAVRAEIESSCCSEPGCSGCSTTVSGGLACTVPCQDDSTVQFIELADQALYHAKHAGRNRVIRAAWPGARSVGQPST